MAGEPGSTETSETLTPAQATERTLGRIASVPAKDMTGENPIRKPVTPGNASALPETPTPDVLQRKQTQIAYEQSVQQGQQVKAEEGLERVAHPPETVAQRLARLIRGEPR
jgi:hypothetical protein